MCGESEISDVFLAFLAIFDVLLSVFMTSKISKLFKNKARKTSDSVIFLTRFRSTMHVHVAYVNKMGCAFLRFIVDQDLGKTKDALDNIYMYVIVT